MDQSTVWLFQGIQAAELASREYNVEFREYNANAFSWKTVVDDNNTSFRDLRRHRILKRLQLYPELVSPELLQRLQDPDEADQDWPLVIKPDVPNYILWLFLVQRHLYPLQDTTEIEKAQYECARHLYLNVARYQREQDSFAAEARRRNVTTETIIYMSFRHDHPEPTPHLPPLLLALKSTLGLQDPHYLLVERLLDHVVQKPVAPDQPPARREEARQWLQFATTECKQRIRRLETVGRHDPLMKDWSAILEPFFVFLRQTPAYEAQLRERYESLEQVECAVKRAKDQLLDAFRTRYSQMSSLFTLHHQELVVREENCHLFVINQESALLNMHRDNYAQHSLLLRKEARQEKKKRRHAEVDEFRERARPKYNSLTLKILRAPREVLPFAQLALDYLQRERANNLNRSQLQMALSRHDAILQSVSHLVPGLVSASASESNHSRSVSLHQESDILLQLEGLVTRHIAIIKDSGDEKTRMNSFLLLYGFCILTAAHTRPLMILQPWLTHQHAVTYHKATTQLWPLLKQLNNPAYASRYSEYHMEPFVSCFHGVRPVHEVLPSTRYFAPHQAFQTHDELDRAFRLLSTPDSEPMREGLSQSMKDCIRYLLHEPEARIVRATVRKFVDAFSELPEYGTDFFPAYPELVSEWAKEERLSQIVVDNGRQYAPFQKPQ